MGLETSTYIDGLVVTNPLSTDPKSAGDDHLRLLKSTIKATFPNVTGAVTPTHTELNFVDGVTSAIQTQLDALVVVDALKAPIASPTFTGTPAAPTAAFGTSTTQLATTAFVGAAAFNAALPSQTGNADKVPTTDGTNASWTASLKASVMRWVDGTDITKKLAFGLSAITTGTTRTMTVPDADFTVAILAANTFTGQQTFAETMDTVYTITDGAAFEIDPANGNVQIVTLGASRTPAATNFAAGQTVILGIDDGTAYAITWTTVAPTWVKAGGAGAAPTLATTGYTWVLLWKVGSTMYAAEVGKP